MRALAYLALRHALHNLGTTLVLTACVAVAAFLPTATWIVMREYSAALRDRARETPLVGGPKGNRFDLTLAALYFRRTDAAGLGAAPGVNSAAAGTAGSGSAGSSSVQSAATPASFGISMREFELARDSSVGVFVPMHVRFAARTRPVVGTTIEYFEQRRARFRSGGCFVILGECVLGSAVAEQLDLDVGDHLFTDQEDVYDISKPPALKMPIAGILEPTGQPDDNAVFVDLKTCWVLEGRMHGHADAADLPDTLVLGKLGTNEPTAPSHVAVSEAMVEYNEITEANADSWHVHGDPGNLAITAYIVWPRTEKQATIIKARTNASRTQQMVSCVGVVEELLGIVLRIKGLLDGAFGALGVCAGSLMALVGILSLRLRGREFQTLNRIGASRGVAVRLAALEWAWVVGAGCMIAGLGAAAVLVRSDAIVRMLMA